MAGGKSGGVRPGPSRHRDGLEGVVIPRRDQALGSLPPPGDHAAASQRRAADQVVFCPAKLNAPETMLRLLPPLVMATP
jgi:hypothetical protein